MQVYDALPQYLKDFYKVYQASPQEIKRAQIKDYFDDPIDHLLVEQATEEIRIHEMLFHVTLDRTLGQSPAGDLYHATTHTPDHLVFRNSRDTEREGDDSGGSLG